MKKSIFIFTSSFLSATVLEYFFKKNNFLVNGICFQKSFLNKKNNIKQRLKNYLGQLNFNMKDNFYYIDPYSEEKKKILKYKKKTQIFYWENKNEGKILDFLSINKVDFIIVAGFKYIHESIYSLSKEFSINIHPGILPQNKGSSPTQWSIYLGEKQTGITIHKLDRKIDSGKILIIKKFKISQKIDNYKLETEINKKIPRVLDNFFFSKFERKSNKKSPVITRKNFNRHKSLLDLSNNYDSIHRNLRAMKPITGLRFLYKGKMICVWQIIKVSKNTSNKSGMIRGIDSNGNLLVACKDYNCKITNVLSFGEILPFSDLRF